MLSRGAVLGWGPRFPFPHAENGVGGGPRVCGEELQRASSHCLAVTPGWASNHPDKASSRSVSLHLGLRAQRQPGKGVWRSATCRRHSQGQDWSGLCRRDRSPLERSQLAFITAATSDVVCMGLLMSFHPVFLFAHGFSS